MTTATQQRAAILDHLSRYGTLTTLEARSGLDIMHPAARVMELRQQGKQIDTIWTVEAAHQGGKLHRVACYLMASEV